MPVEYGEVTMPAEVWCEQNMRSGVNRMMGCVSRVAYPCKCGRRQSWRTGFGLGRPCLSIRSTAHRVSGCGFPLSES